MLCILSLRGRRMNKKTKTSLVLSLLLIGLLVSGFKTLAISSVSSSLPSQGTVDILRIDWWTMYKHDPQHTSYSLSVAPNSNQTLWIKQFNDWIRSSPAVHNNVVFVASDENKIYAFNATTGIKIWEYLTKEDITSSPAIAYGRVYFGCEDNRLYCLNETSGTLLWSFETGGDIASSPCVNEDKVLFGSNDHNLYCLDAVTGNSIWTFSTGEAIISSPAIANETVFFGSLDFRVYALNLANGRLIWNYTTTSGITVSPSVAKNKVFFSSYKTIFCFNTSDGEVLWQYEANSLIHSSPSVDDKNIYFGCDDNNLYCLNIENGELRWCFATKNMIYSSPAITDGKVFFGSKDANFYCLNASVGTLIWSYNTSGSITSSPAIANKIIYVSANYYPPFYSKLFAFGPANAPPVAFNLTIFPSSPDTTQNLTANYEYYDEEGDLENGTEIRWYKNGVLQSEFNDTRTISHVFTVKGQKWYFTVRPKDGKNFGIVQTSSEVTIQNSPPVIVSYYPLVNPVIAEGEMLEFNITKYDVDDDLLMVEWYINETRVIEDCDSYIYVANFDSAAIYNVTVVVFDGTDRTTHEWLLTVINVEHDIAVTSVSLSKTILGQGYSMKINVTIENQGTVNETFVLVIYANATIIHAREITLANKSSFNIVFTWDSTSFLKGKYNMSVVVDVVYGEIETEDNVFVCGWMTVTIPGDVDGNFRVNIYDAVKIGSIYAVLASDSRFNPNSDIDGDGVISILDLVICTRHYGEVYP